MELLFEEIRSKIQNSGYVLGSSVRAEAEFFHVSPAQWSRIRSGKSSPGDVVIEKVLAKFREIDPRSVDELERKFQQIRNSPIRGSSFALAYGSYSIANITDLFRRFSNSASLLLVDYRDFPQADEPEAYPEITESLIAAIKSGLSVGLFSPFGSPTSLMTKSGQIHEHFSKKMVSTNDHAFLDHMNDFIRAYTYLTTLAIKIRKFYGDIKKRTEGGEGRVVLYEADYGTEGDTQHGIPTIVASGIQSRLFYAEQLEKGIIKPSVYEWVVAAGNKNDEHLFIERSTTSLSFNAVRMQFSPIPAFFWKENPRRLPETAQELDSAYRTFGLSEFIAKEKTVKWRVP